MPRDVFLLQPLIQPPHLPGLMRQQVLSLSEVAVASLLSSQQALRKPDRRNGLMVMMMGWVCFFVGDIEICEVFIPVLNNSTLW